MSSDISTTRTFRRNNIDFSEDVEAAESLRRFLLVLTSKFKSSDEEAADYVAEDEDEVLQWFRELGHYAWHDTQMRAIPLKSNNHELILPKFFLLLNECLLTHRWTDVLHILTRIVKQPALQAPTIFKVGLEVFQREGTAHPELLQKLVRWGSWYSIDVCCSQFKNVAALNVKEVVLDYVLLLMSQGHHQEARENFTNIGRGQLDRKKPTADICQLDAIFEAYNGLVWFVEWQTLCNEVEDLRQREREGTLGEEMGILQHKEQLLDSHGKKALNGFRGLENQPGLWDIFIKMYIKIFEYGGMITEAEDILKAYCVRNPDNPNAHRYLYEFYLNHGYDVEVQLQPLQQYCDKVPSDELALVFHSMLLQKGEPAHECLYLLFDLLDYACWQDKVTVWERLAEQLHDVTQNESLEGAAHITQCWEMRSSWWPQYHFRNMHTSDGSEGPDHLLQAKLEVANVLLGQGKAASMEVQQVKIQT